MVQESDPETARVRKSGIGGGRYVRRSSRSERNGHCLSIFASFIPSPCLRRGRSGSSLRMSSVPSSFCSFEGSDEIVEISRRRVVDRNDNAQLTIPASRKQVVHAGSRQADSRLRMTESPRLAERFPEGQLRYLRPVLRQFAEIDPSRLCRCPPGRAEICFSARFGRRKCRDIEAERGWETVPGRRAARADGADGTHVGCDS